MRNILLASVFILLIYFPVTNYNQPVTPDPIIPQKEEKIVSPAEKAWVDSVYAALSLEEKIAQLMMIRAHSDLGASHEQSVLNLVETHQVGGLVFFQGTPEKQGELCNRYQAASKLPMLIGMDAEWGLGMRMKASTQSFPKQMTLGAIQNNTLIYDMGQEVARQCKRLGVHINFAPVVDVNNNPDNPVIYDRSFGEDRFNVAAKSYMYMKGMQDANVMACAKHFPGHGDTKTDSHHDLPLITHGRPRLDSVEMYPFKVLASQGIQSMMVAHLAIPALDDTPNLPTTLSKKTVTGILKNELGFDGLIITDGMDMAGVTKHHQAGDAEVKAFQAGNDILLLPTNVQKAVTKIKEALASGAITEERLSESVHKVLHAKYTVGLNKYKPIVLSNIRKDLNTLPGILLEQRLAENALTLVKNEGSLVPITQLKGKSFATVSIGSKYWSPFQTQLGMYADFTHFPTPKDIPAATANSLLRQLKERDVVIIGLHELSKSRSRNFGVSATTLKFIKDLSKETKVIIVAFGTPYSLELFEDEKWVICAYSNDKQVQELTAQAIFGALNFSGKLPVSAGKLKAGMGERTGRLGRLQYGSPESMGVNSDTLNLIDELVAEAIKMKAMPGCQILVAKNGKVIFNKGYGYHTYNKQRRVSTSDIYDLASITKVAATTISMMELEEQGKVDLGYSMGSCLSKVNGTDKSNLILRDVMAHRSRLASWIPFYQETVTKKSKRPKTDIYKSSPNADYNTEVCANLYIKDDYQDVMWEQITSSTLRSKSAYKYSDLGFIMCGEVVKEKSTIPLDQFAYETFYGPLGLSTMTFKPLEKHSKSEIPPTEKDTYFRHQTIDGYVHDMGCAMFGGVSGHAGLFSNANDLAILMQMLLNEGYYGGIQFLEPATVKKYTTRHHDCTRRGIGFDMPELNASKNKNLSELASPETFGHLGFTGTSVWVDPKHELTFIFLSNRTYPDMDNWKLNKENFRPRIQDVVYHAIGVR